MVIWDKLPKGKRNFGSGEKGKGIKGLRDIALNIGQYRQRNGV